MSLALFDEDEHIVEDALAFIDAFYASTSERQTTEIVPDVHALRDSQVSTLLSALRHFHAKLTAMTRSRPFTTPVNDLEGVPGAEVIEIQQRLDQCRQLWHQVFGHNVRRQYFMLEDVNVAGFLRRRLDELVSCAAAGACEQPHVEQRVSFEEVSDQYFDRCYEGAAVRFRSARYVPFKLSLLASATWSVIAKGTFGMSVHSLVPEYEHTDGILGRFQDDPDLAEGAAILRRVYLPDGTILICWVMVSEARAGNDHSYDFEGNAKLHHHGWVRIGRLTADGSSRVRVYSESVSDFVLESTTRACDDAHRRQFDRFRAHFSAISENEERYNGRQMIDNRILDMSRQTSSRQPTRV